MEGSMNAGRRCSLACLALTTSLATAATASPIQYTASVTAPQIWSPTPIAVDLSRGGSYEVGSPALAPVYGGTLAYTTKSVPLDGDAYVNIDSSDPQDPTHGGWVEVRIPISGSIRGDGATSDLQGGYAGIGSSALTNDSTRASLPAPMLDLLANPERVSISAFVTGGHMSYLQTTLSIGATADPAPVPEPSALATLLLGVWVFVWRRRGRTSA
jgi:hypothetical protein